MLRRLLIAAGIVLLAIIELGAMADVGRGAAYMAAPLDPYAE